MRIKKALPGGANDLVRPENGGKLPNGTVYPQVTGDDALTPYSNSLERIVAAQQRNSGNNIQFPPKFFYVLNARQSVHVFHPHPPYNQGSIIWGYDGIYPGPTFISRYGDPILVRIKNGLYDDPRANPKVEGQEVPGGFGDPRISTHLHNGHTGSESDGNPADIYPPINANPGRPSYPDSVLGIRFRDHHYGMFRAGLNPDGPNPNDGDISETVSTLWYHDHSMDKTSENVYKGLVGFHLLFDEVDSGNEDDPTPGALRLPSGQFDVPLLIQDKRFGPDGQLLLPRSDDPNVELFEFGFLGDVFVVNGQIQPRVSVSRRKYRFRMLNAGPSRFYQLFLTKDNVDQPYVYIGNDQSLLEMPYMLPASVVVFISVAERADVIIDFSKYAKGDKLFLNNRLVMQDSGMGPAFVPGPAGKPFVGFTVLPAGQGDNILCFEVGDDALDPSQVPATLRENPTIPSYARGPGKQTPEQLKNRTNHRSFEFGFDGTFKWVINGRPFDPSPAGLAAVRVGSLDTPRAGLPGEPHDGEVWTLKHTADWSHPVHIHLEEFHIIWRNGVAVPPYEQSKKDVLRLDPFEEVQIFVRFRDFFGKYPIHCHNVVHEDHEMMHRFDVVGDN